jgi:hypothetical protein
VDEQGYFGKRSSFSSVNRLVIGYPGSLMTCLEAHSTPSQGSILVLVDWLLEAKVLTLSPC